MNPYFQQIAFGKTLPLNNIHAVSASFSQMQDVIRYEEKDPELEKQLKSGYPRFVLHPYLGRMIDHLRERYQISTDFEILLFSSPASANYTATLYHLELLEVESDQFGGALLKQTDPRRDEILSFLQHSGFTLSSRFAEDYLMVHHLLADRQVEKRDLGDAPKMKVKQYLADAYGQPLENVGLAVSGMNAVFSTFMGIKEVQAEKGRDLFIQLGWLYRDTILILNKFGKEVVVIPNVTDNRKIQHAFDTYGDRIAAVFTEAPTNPLVQTIDFPFVKGLASRYDVPLIVDTTFGTPHNIDLTSYGDIFIESLTKFAGGHGDLLGGAVIINQQSRFHFSLEELLKIADPLYRSDAQRLAFEVEGYQDRVQRIGKNTVALVKYLEKHPAIKKVYWALDPDVSENYLKIAKSEDAVCGVISVTFNGSFQEIYDRIPLPKGPSLGTDFTLLMPYVYLAHYDMIQSEAGQKELAEAEIPVDLLRISVGLEKIDTLIAQFEKAFA